MKRVLVTGGTGFVGANLLRRLVEQGHQVHAIVRSQSQQWRLKTLFGSKLKPGDPASSNPVASGQLQFLQADLADQSNVNEVVRRVHPDWIFHLAVHGAYSWQTDLTEIISNNISATANLLQACAKAGFESFVNTGSSSEYGPKDHAPRESEVLEPNSYYAVTKAASTLLCRHLASSQNLQIPTLRLYSVYGSYEDPKRLLPTLITNGLSGKLPILVDPSVARDYVYIEDVLDAYLLAADFKSSDPGAIYNVGSGIQTTLKEIVDVACKILPVLDEPNWGSMENRAWDTSCWVSNNEKLVKDLNWSPKYSLESGFSHMVQWFRDSPEMQDYYRKVQLAAENTKKPVAK